MLRHYYADAHTDYKKNVYINVKHLNETIITKEYNAKLIIIIDILHECGEHVKRIESIGK